MPTVLRIGPYRFFFYSNEGSEPPHIHVEHDGAEAKFWLLPVEYCRSVGFSRKELRTIQEHVMEHQEQLRDAWHEHFSF